MTKAIQDIATNGALLNQSLSKLVTSLGTMVLPTNHGGTGQTYGGLIPRYTTAERDALVSPEDGLVIYNTTLEEFQGRANGAWETILLQDSPTINTPTMSAGTTARASFNLTSGTNLTTAVAGAWEYNGKAPMFTPLGTQRGIVPAMQFYRLNSSLAGSNGTSAQSLFGVGCTLSASTVYAFQLVFSLTKSAGTTSHTIAFGFGGTATITNVSYQTFYTLTLPAPGVGATPSLFQTSSAGSTVYTNAITKASVQHRQIIIGTVSINAGGTFIPQYTLSAAPGGAYSTDLGSFMTIYPLSASGANTNVGTWA